MGISKNIEKEIVDLIQKGISLREISRRTMLSRRTVKNVGVRNGIIKLEETEKLKKAYELWESGKSIESVAKELRLYKGDLSLYIKQKGRNAGNSSQKYKYNTNVFKKIDNEFSAYWLGFITADGCITEHKRNGKVCSMVLEIGLAEKDYAHLEKFCDFIGVSKEKIRNKEVYLKATDKYYNTCNIQIHNTEICRDLINLGVTPRKSETAEFCNYIPDEFKIHYLRGYVDGDGYFRKNNSYSLTMLATLTFINSVIENFNIKSYGINSKNEKDKVYNLRINSKESKDLIKKMYVNSNIYLDRKYKKAIAVLGRNI